MTKAQFAGCTIRRRCTLDNERSSALCVWRNASSGRSEIAADFFHPDTARIAAGNAVADERARAVARYDRHGR